MYPCNKQEAHPRGLAAGVGGDEHVEIVLAQRQRQQVRQLVDVAGICPHAQQPRQPPAELAKGLCIYEVLVFICTRICRYGWSASQASARTPSSPAIRLHNGFRICFT